MVAFQENSVASCSKHYIGDCRTTYGSSKRFAINKGDVIMTEDELRDAFLEPYKQFCGLS